MRTEIERQADRTSWIILLFGAFLSCVVEGTDTAMEAARSGLNISMRAEWLYEISSHIAILIASIVFPLALSRYPITADNILRRLPVIFATFALFFITHILLMVGLRVLIYPMIAAGHYEFGLTRLEPWIYEMRKDALTFIMIGSIFLTSRQIAYLKQESRENTKQAQESGRIILRCGGRSLFLPAQDIAYARSAGNYVDIKTDNGAHLARITLSALLKLLRAAGDAHIQIHRSTIVRRADIREIIPTGGGEAKAVLHDGTELPISRKYRADLQ